MSEFISAGEREWNGIHHLSKSISGGSSIYRKIVTDYFACQVAKRDFVLAWFPKSHDNAVENL
jgi:hypothetical protein